MKGSLVEEVSLLKEHFMSRDFSYVETVLVCSEFMAYECENMLNGNYEEDEVTEVTEEGESNV